MLSPFYVFQIFSIVIWSIDAYLPYGMLILAITLFSVLRTLWETRKNLKKLRQLAYYECQVTVFRNRASDIPLRMSSAKLVPGDIFIIPENCMMPCDAILLNGSCIMNESMLTGESIPVIKNSLPSNEIPYSIQDDKQYTLFAGTYSLQTRSYKGKSATGLVTDVGFATIKGELIRTMLFPKASNFKFYIDCFKFLGFMGVLAIIGFSIILKNLLEQGAFRVFIKGAEIITTTVPPALPACMAIGVSYGLGKLRDVGMFCISPNKINEAGKVRIMCFDKTGTLTEDGLDIMGVRTIFFESSKIGFRKLQTDISVLGDPPKARDQELQKHIAFEKARGESTLFESTKMLPDELMLEIMSTCHSLTMIDTKLIGDPLDVKMFEATSCVLDENLSEKSDYSALAIIKKRAKQPKSMADVSNELTFQPDTSEIEIIRRFEFSSKLQRMSVIVKHNEESGFRMHIKGSPEKIRELCKPSTIPSKFHHVLDKYAENGYRVLGLATKMLNVDYKKVATTTREDLEQHFTFIGLLVMENKLKPITTSIIDALQEAQIKTVMVTGDNVLTAISVARQCHIVLPNQRVFLGDISEKKVGNQNVLIWRDFERSDHQLNPNDLEPQLLNDSQADFVFEEEKEKENEIYMHKTSGSPSKAKSQSVYASLQMKPSSRPISLNKSGLEDRPKTIAIQPKTRESKFESIVSNTREDFNFELIDLEPAFFDLEPQEYTLAVTGKAFAHILKEAELEKDPKYIEIFDKMLNGCSVYARMLPDQKALMITHLQKLRGGVMVGMCGDGANDCGALKAADVGVSLSEAEASIAAPFTSNVGNISCIIDLLKYGRAALVTSFQTFKFILLYSVIEFTTTAVVYNYLVDLTNPNYYYVDIFLVFPLSAAMAMQEASPQLSKYQPRDRLVSWPILTSFIGQSAIQIIFQLIIVMVIFRPEFNTVPCNSDDDGNAMGCSLNTALFVFANFQYTSVAIMFNVGRPFRKSFYENKTFTILFIIMISLNFYLAIGPFPWVRNLLQMAELETDFLFYYLLPLVFVNSLCTFIWEKVFVRFISSKVRDFKQRSLLQNQKKDSIRSETYVL